MAHQFELKVDPRVLAGGTTLADISAQVDLQLEITELLSSARRLEDALATEQEELEELELTPKSQKHLKSKKHPWIFLSIVIIMIVIMM